jgi:hypothetical protein
MSVDQIIKELKALPREQRLQVVDAVLSEDDSWVPESFRQGMKDIEEGRVVDMETALTQKPPDAE